MEMRALGTTGLQCGVIGLGTWQTFDVSLGSHEEMQTRTEIVDVALRSGGNFFDSSPMYGRSEAVLGRTLQGKRDRALVATKVWAPEVTQGRQQIEQALRYYDGYVDLYQVHNLVSWRDYLPLLRDLRGRAAIRAIGVTHYAHSAFPTLAKIMESEEIGAVQLPYNASDRAVEHHLLPLAAERGIGVIVMSPLGSGRLARPAPTASDLLPLERFGITTWAQALLKWVVSDQRVTVTIPATSHVGRATENAAAGNPPFFGPEERELVTWLANRLRPG